MMLPNGDGLEFRETRWHWQMQTIAFGSWKLSRWEEWHFAAELENLAAAQALKATTVSGWTVYSLHRSSGFLMGRDLKFGKKWPNSGDVPSLISLQEEVAKPGLSQWKHHQGPQGLPQRCEQGWRRPSWERGETSVPRLHRAVAEGGADVHFSPFFWGHNHNSVTAALWKKVILSKHECKKHYSVCLKYIWGNSSNNNILSLTFGSLSVARQWLVPYWAASGWCGSLCQALALSVRSTQRPWGSATSLHPAAPQNEGSAISHGRAWPPTTGSAGSPRVSRAMCSLVWVLNCVSHL